MAGQRAWAGQLIGGGLEAGVGLTRFEQFSSAPTPVLDGKKLAFHLAFWGVFHLEISSPAYKNQTGDQSDLTALLSKCPEECQGSWS
jgi:hypothetical protein